MPADTKKMRRQREDMQVNVAGLRRNLKNLAHNYSDAQVKVREATSNDPWGPSSTLMSEIADLTYNVVAYTEIMHMIWKRLNDHGRYWRHVYKALVLLEYLIKTGSEKVASQCKENIFAIQTLRDFQYMDEGKDQGLNVREKAKQLVLLLRDEERLKNERARALKAKERFAQTASGFGSDTTLDATSPSSPNFQGARQTWGSCDSDPSSRSMSVAALDLARPQTAGEEELQLQLALAMSREEAEQEEQKRRSDDVRLQLAISQSQNDTNSPSPRQQLAQQPSKSKENNTHMLDLLDVNLSPVDSVPVSSSPSLGATAAQPTPHLDPWGIPIPPPRPQTLAIKLPTWDVPQQMDPWSVSTASSVSDPWSPVPAQPPLPKSESGYQLSPMNCEPGYRLSPMSCVAPNDPWKTVSPPPPARPNDPWSPATEPSPASLASPISNTDLDDFDIITNRDRHSSNNVNNNKNGTVSPNPFDMSGLEDSMNGGLGSTGVGAKRSPQSFLGENSALVNLDNLVTKPLPPPPHLAAAVPPPLPTTKANPFSTVTGLQPARQAYPPPSQGLPQPLVPQPANPFLS